MAEHAIARAVLCLSLAVCAASAATNGLDVTRELAAELLAESDDAAAAVEYRRLALEHEGEERSGYFWAAAYAYWRDGQWELAQSMLDRAEEASAGIAPESQFLRAEASAGAAEWDEAAFLFDSVLRGPADDDVRSMASRRLACAHLRGGRAADAREAAAASPLPADDALEAIDRYERESDRSPVVGGLLGLVPGLGHAYSGEYANGLRAFLLNAVFIFAMADTAADEEWGAFAAVTFFEFTWYTGSVYGGVDAAHRFNRERLDRAGDDVTGGARWTADPALFPAVRLTFTF